MLLLFTQGQIASQSWQILNLYNNSHISDSISAMPSKLGMTVDMHDIYDNLDLDARP